MNLKNTFSQRDKYVNFKHIALPLLFFLFSIFYASAQTVEVSGTVSNEKGDPVSGATISESGTQRSTVTDDKGFFRFSINQTSSLEVSSIGYRKKTVPVGTGGILLIQLEPSEETLSEVVITGFGGSQIKKDLTGNIARIKGKDIEFMPTPSVDAALQGKAAGVLVNSQTGKLGQAVTVRVRGNSSISASNQPLFVLDGVPITTDNQASYGGAMNPLTDINPNDIESIEILKDASAGAIFGSRAANGVVLITTKRGRSGKTVVTLNLQSGFSNPTNKINVLNSEQYAELYLEAAGFNDIQGGIDPNDPDSWTNYAKGNMEYNSLGGWSKDPTKTYLWQDQAFQKSPYFSADLQVRGGTDKTKFFTSFQHLDQTGIMVGNNLARTSGRLNLDQKANDWLDLGVSLNLTRTAIRRLPTDAEFANPLQGIAQMPMTPFTDPATGLDIGTAPGDINVPLYYNPMLTVKYAKFSQEVYRTFGNAFARIRLTKDLSFQTEFGIDYLSQNEEGFYQSQTVRNDAQAVRGRGVNTGTFITNFNTNSYFTYNKESGKHNFNATLGMQYQESSAKYNSLEGTDFPSDSYRKVASAATKTRASSSQSDFRFLSYFLRFNYIFNDKYLLSASGRLDGSSRFGENSRNGFFPAISAGWILTNEGFLDDNKYLSFLKLRASYGIVGNAEIGNYPQLGLFSGNAGYAGVGGQQPVQLPNPDLKWETTTQFDVGVDFGLFKNRVTGELDYYYKQTDDLLLNVNVPSTSGYTTQTRNIGSLENKGFEFVLNTQNTIGEFRWSTNLMLGNNKGKVRDIDGQIITGGFFNRAQEGYPIGVFYTVEYAGVDPSNGDALFYKNTKNTNGALDKTTTNDYNQADRIVAGDPNPDWIWGFTNNFTYKGFDLSIFFNGVSGNQISTYGMGRYSIANMLYEDNNTVDQMQRWQKPGDVTNVPQARLYTVNGSQESTRYIASGSYIRLRTMSLGYTFNSKLTQKIKMEKIRLYVSALNLMTFTDYPLWDPEVNWDDADSNISKGNDFYTPPQPMTILFGININF